MMASAKAAVPAVPPRSAVTVRPSPMTSRTAASSRSAWPGVAEVPEHQGSGQDHRGGIGLVEPRVLRRRPVDRLEDGAIRADVGPRRHAETADQPGAEVAHDVAVQVREHQDVVELRLLDELHAHVVDDPVLELDPALVRRRHGPAALEEQAVRELHDVGLVDGGHLVPAVRDRVVEGEPRDPLRRGTGDDLDALGGVGADHVLDAGVEVLGVLADDHEVDVLVARVEPAHRARRTQVRVQPQLLAERDVGAPEPPADGRGDRALEGYLVALDRLEHVVRERRAVGGDRRLAGLDGLPFEPDARSRPGHGSSPPPAPVRCRRRG